MFNKNIVFLKKYERKNKYQSKHFFFSFIKQGKSVRYKKSPFVWLKSKQGLDINVKFLPVKIRNMELNSRTVILKNIKITCC